MDNKEQNILINIALWVFIGFFCIFLWYGYAWRIAVVMAGLGDILIFAGLHFYGKYLLKAEIKDIGKKIWENEAGIPINIDYADFNGRQSRRKVIIHSVSLKKTQNKKKPYLYLQAYCELRKEPRTFRLDKISSFYDDKGEIIDVENFLSGLGLDPKIIPKVKK